MTFLINVGKAMPLWEIQSPGLLDKRVFIQFVLHHKLSQVSHHLAAGCHLKNLIMSIPGLGYRVNGTCNAAVLLIQSSHQRKARLLISSSIKGDDEAQLYEGFRGY